MSTSPVPGGFSWLRTRPAATMAPYGKTATVLLGPSSAWAAGRRRSAGRTGLLWCDNRRPLNGANRSRTRRPGSANLDRPISVGELVELHATLVYTGRTAMYILVTVLDRSQPGRTREHLAMLNHLRRRRRRRRRCPRRGSALDAGHILELQRHRQARARIPMRKRIEDAMGAQQYTPAGTTPHAKLGFLASPTEVNWGRQSARLAVALPSATTHRILLARRTIRRPGGFGRYRSTSRS